MFDSCTSLESVDLNNVQFIDNWAFYGCISLAEIALPEALVEIGEAAFYGCTSLETVTFGNPSTVYWASSFEGCIFAPDIDEEGFVAIDITMYTNATSNYRSTPSFEEDNVAGQLLEGDAARVVGISIDNGWAKIEIEEAFYYIRWSLLEYESIENV